MKVSINSTSYKRSDFDGKQAGLPGSLQFPLIPLLIKEAINRSLLNGEARHVSINSTSYKRSDCLQQA